jgi:hypothetical protein
LAALHAEFMELGMPGLQAAIVEAEKLDIKLNVADQHLGQGAPDNGRLASEGLAEPPGIRTESSSGLGSGRRDCDQGIGLLHSFTGVGVAARFPVTACSAMKAWLRVTDGCRSARPDYKPKTKCFWRKSLFTFRAPIQPFFFQELCEVVNVDAVAQARIFFGRLNNSDATVAVIVSRYSAIKQAEGFDFAFSGEFHDFVAVLGFSSVSVMHVNFSFCSATFGCRSTWLGYEPTIKASVIALNSFGDIDDFPAFERFGCFGCSDAFWCFLRVLASLNVISF